MTTAKASAPSGTKPAKAHPGLPPKAGPRVYNSDADWAYIAGFLEADGHITFVNGKSWSAPIIGFVQVDEGLAALDKIAHIFDAHGIQYTRGRYKQSGDNRWQMRNQMCVKQQDSVVILLTAIVEHLTFKKKLASVALETTIARLTGPCGGLPTWLHRQAYMVG